MSLGEAIEEIDHLVHDAEAEAGHDGHDHGLEDPHFWFDPLRVKLAINSIAEELSAIDAAGSESYSAKAAAYNAQLDELHAWTIEQVEVVPEDNRVLLTSHDSLGYFADRYGFDVVGVILGITTQVEPSAAHLAELTEIIEKYHVPAVFGETTVSERLAAALAAETGADLVRLYSGSLGAEGSGAETFLGMVRANVESIVNALK
jgi:ABC-type Zn uptake system ZnuABC Zn-binding protein ZnuA